MKVYREMKYLTGRGTCDCCGRHSFTRIKKGDNKLCYECFENALIGQKPPAHGPILSGAR